MFGSNTVQSSWANPQQNQQQKFGQPQQPQANPIFGNLGTTTTFAATSPTAGNETTGPVAPVTTGTFNPLYRAFVEKEPNSNIPLQYQTITATPIYRGASLEELRYQDYQQGRKTAFGQRSFGATQPPFASTSTQPANASIFGGGSGTGTGTNVFGTTGTIGTTGTGFGGFGQGNETTGPVAPVTTGTSNPPYNTFAEKVKYQATHQAQTCDAEVQDYDTEAQGSESKILVMNSTLRNAFISGDLSAAEELLTQEIDAKGDSFRPYANRSVVMARKLDWDHALDDATESLSIQPSFMGYVSKGIALCGKKQVRNANKAFDFASTFTDGDPRTNHFLFLVKAVALSNANMHADAMRRVQELAATCPNADTVLTCRILEVYLRIQQGNNALDRACPAQAANHFTAAVNTGTFLTKLATHPKYEDFVVLFGCDFTSLWQTANQKRCHALLRAGRLVEVFEAYRYMANMSDETTKASCLDWSIGFIQELSAFQHNASNVDATPNMCKYEDEKDSISDIDSDIDHVDDVVC